MSHYDRDPSTGTLIRTDGGLNLQDMKALMLEFCYPVGSFYISTKNVSPQTFLGGTWESRSGYMLRAATSGVTFDKANDTNDGGADSVTVSSVASHNHTQNGHDHTAYGVNPTGSSGTAPYMSFQGDGNVVIYYSNGVGAVGLGNTSGRGSSKALTVGGNTSHTVSNKVATNQDNGANYTVNTLPKYKNVYMWERTA